jgi:hypothetical protein
MVVRLTAAAVFLFVLLWHFTEGPGGLGRTPRGTAYAFVQAIRSNRCADRMEESFTNVAGSRSLCTPDLQHAFSSRRSVSVRGLSADTAVAICFFGST